MFRQGLTDTEEFRKLSAARYRTSPIGFEFQILDDRSHPDSANGPHRKTGALYDLLPRNREPEAPAGAFNRGRILVQGPRVEHWVNGVKVLEYDRRGPRLRNSIAASKFADMPGFGQNARGRITLQDHGDEVWFRRIRIRELR